MTHAPARMLALLLSGVLAASLLLPASGTPASGVGRNRGPAVAALERVEDLMQRLPPPGTSRAPGGAGPRRGAAGAGRGELTMALRDLAATRHHLGGPARRTADRLLARPSNGSETPYSEPKYGNRKVRSTCSAVACVHRVATGQHAATAGYADRVLAAVTASHVAVTGQGFRPPLGDGTRGGDARPDIYLADLGGAYFGYAVPEGHQTTGGKLARFGYVVVDNDYTEFCGGGCGDVAVNRFMKATTAHEYFHLVQFGYDYLEDRWFMEATATWVEDEVFDGVDDNVYYLGTAPSALQTPWVPLDAARAVPYGNWIWFRHLSERLGADVVRKAWDRADAWRGHLGSRNPSDLYSVQALRRAVVSEDGRWNRDFAAFAADNQQTRRHYEEGRALRYPSAPRAGNVRLTVDRRRIVREYRLSRLSSATHRVRPGQGVRRGWKLRVVVEGNTAPRGGQALATVRLADGSFQRVSMPLGRNGRTVKRLPFGKAAVRWVEITVVNASTRNDCWLGKRDNTCRGRSRDNNRPQRVVFKAVR